MKECIKARKKVEMKESDEGDQKKKRHFECLREKMFKKKEKKTKIKKKKRCEKWK